MKVTTERLENCQVRVVIELDEDEIDKKLRQTARQISRQFNLPGYRRGKAPFHTVVRIVGREAVQQQALEDFGDELYEEALKEIEYKPFQSGELEDVEWDPFRMKVLLPIPPEVELGDYRAVRVPFEVPEVSEEAVDEHLAGLQRRFSQWVPVERPAAFGDQVVLDLEGKVGDQLFMSNEEYEMRLEEGASYPLPGFHEQIVGLSPDEEKTFTLTLPDDDFDEEFAGQEGTITVLLHTVREEDLPALDDDLALMVGDYETLEDLRAAVRADLEAEALKAAESEYVDAVLDAMIEAAVKIEYPPQAVDQEAEAILARLEQSMASSGLELDTYLGMLGKTREMYKQEVQPLAEDRLKKELVLVSIGEREGLSVEDAEIDQEVEQLVAALGEDERGQQVLEFVQSPMGRLSIADDLLGQQVRQRVIQIGKGEAPPLEEEEGEEAADKAAEAEAEADADAAPEEAAAESEEAAPEPEAEAEAEAASEEPEESAPEAEAEPIEESVADAGDPEGEGAE